MIIKASASIRQNYNEISELCKATKEPVYLTKNGEGDLVVMDIESSDHFLPGRQDGCGLRQQSPQRPHHRRAQLHVHLHHPDSLGPHDALHGLRHDDHEPHPPAPLL